MTKNEAQKRIKKLRDEIQRYRNLRLTLNKELISPEAEDALKKELFDLEQSFPDLITPDSPTQRVGGHPLREFKKVRHSTPMLSFNDAFSREDMNDWLTRLENYLGKSLKHADVTRTNAEEGQRKSASSLRSSAFYCELKIDGLAIELIYENGIFVRGSTRGDGSVGEDVTQNLKTIDAIPLKILEPDEVEKNLKHLGLQPTTYNLQPRRLIVRGEAFITRKEFEAVNTEQTKKGLKTYANPRNIAAGSIRQLDPKIMAKRRLDSFEYDIVTDLGQKSHEEEHLLLKAFGFKTNLVNRPAKDLEEVFGFRDEWEKKREHLNYEIDGIVVVVNDNKVFDEAGVIGKAPRAAIAYKFSPREATTQVLDIKVQIGRTGALTPVAVMKPVGVGGITITHATLHNADEIERLGLKIGDTVIVSRAGDVIPQVTSVLKNLRTGHEKIFKMPTRCPIDGSRVVRDGVAYKCSSKTCGARHRESLYHFVSKGAFDIEGLGPKIIDRFLDEGLISDAADIFALKKEDINTLERFGEKSAENIVEEIDSKKTVSLPRFIYALGILHVGEETAILLAQAISKSEFLISKPTNVLKVFHKFSLEKLQEIPDIGPKVAQSIHDWFRESRNIKLVEKLEKAEVRILKQEARSKKQALAGKTFVLTGGLESMSREAAKEKVRKLGGDISESVSKKTDYVIVGAEPGSKFDKAKKLGIKILTEAQFLEIIK